MASHGRKHRTSKDHSLPPGLRGAENEDLVEIIDHKEYLLKYRKDIQMLMAGQIDVPQFLKKLAPDMVMRLGQVALTSKNDKVRLAALTDFLDRAGYSKVEKHAIANIDPSLPQEQLISMLEGIGKKTGEIEIED